MNKEQERAIKAIQIWLMVMSVVITVVVLSFCLVLAGYPGWGGFVILLFCSLVYGPNLIPFSEEKKDEESE